MPTETLIHLERGQPIKPFEGKTEFLPVDLEELLSNFHSSHFGTNEPVLTADVIFEGIGGQLAVAANSRVGTVAGAETPLGPVATEIEHNNGIAVVRQIPLHLQLDFWVRSQEDWQKLQDNRAVFDLGRHTYPTRYSNLEGLGMTSEKFQQGLADFKILTAQGTLAMPQTYNPARVLLPYNVGILSQGINLTMGKA